VELSNSQFNPPCFIESFDSKVDPTSKKKKTNVKKPPKKVMITKKNSKPNGQQGCLGLRV